MTTASQSHRPVTATAILGSLLPLLVCLSLPSSNDAFTASPHCTTTLRTRTPSSSSSTTNSNTHQPLSRRNRYLPLLQTTHYDDFGDFFFPPGGSNNNEDNNKKNKNNEGSSDSDLYAALKERQASLEQEQQFGGGLSSSSPSTPSSSLFSSTASYQSSSARSTSDEEEEDQEIIRYNWKEANCVSSVRLQLDDWIRRIAVDLYPLVVCGSARGHLYLADLEASNGGSSSNGAGAGVSTAKNDGSPAGRRVGQLDCLKRVHASHLEESIDTESPEQLNEAMEVLFGNYDGGGVLAIAAKKDWIVSSGREGGIHVCSIVGTEEDVYTGSRGGKSKQTRLHLQPLGRIRGLEEKQDDFYGKLEPPLTPVPPTFQTPPLITSLAFDDQGTLWAAGYDGILRGYDYEQTDVDDQPLMLRQKHPDHEVDMGSSILSITVNDEIGCGVATTLNQGAVLFSLHDGNILTKWNPFENTKRGEFARSAILVQTDKPQPVDDPTTSIGSNDSIYPDSHWSVIVGGSKGTLFQRPIGIQVRNGIISEKQPLMELDEGYPERRIRPNHLGQIVAMSSPSPGLLVTGSHDGTMRVWDCSLYKTEEEEEDGEEGTATDISIELVDDDTLVQSKTKKPRVLYALSGYKVWLGSIFANDRKLVSDGADNSIIVHSFDEDEEDVLRSREEDDEELDDFTFD